MEKIQIFDTTLRDGEQAPSCSMTIDEKIRVAKQLEKLGVDVIEAGFAASSKKDQEAIMEISKVVRKPVITALARLVKSDIDKANDALCFANKKRIHVFIATSPIHMQDKLHMSEEEVLAKVEELVTYTKTLVDDVEFSAEDATRSEISFLTKVYQKAIDCGATVINIPDTVGYMIPGEYMLFIEKIKANLKVPSNVSFSCHCHNDLGMAVANSLAAISMGIRQVECTINGIGERAGNASMHEIVAALSTRYDYFKMDTNICKKEIYASSQMIAEVIASPIPRNEPIIGENAFKHESGIHQHGVLSNQMTYEIMKASDYGVDYDPIVLGVHSGHHAIAAKIEQMGYCASEYAISEITDALKEVYEVSSSISEEEFSSIISQHKIIPKSYHK